MREVVRQISSPDWRFDLTGLGSGEKMKSRRPRHYGGAMQPVSPVNLALSLLFGVGQIVVGALFVAHGRNRWRRAGVFLVMLVGAWFVCSGVIELFVSGMESLQRLSGVPDHAAFSLWRGRADTALAVATGVILLVGGVVALSGKLSWRRGS